MAGKCMVFRRRTRIKSGMLRCAGFGWMKPGGAKTSPRFGIFFWGACYLLGGRVSLLPAPIVLTIFMVQKKKDYHTIRATTYENDYLNKLAIDELAAKYDEKYMQQELLGQFVIFEGAVYYTFNRQHNAGDLAFKLAQYNFNIPIWLACDFNVDPMAWVIMQWGINADTKLKEVYVIDEIYMKNSNTVDACAEFKSRFPNHRAGVRLYGDATGRARHTDSNITNWKIIENELSAYNISSRIPTK